MRLDKNITTAELMNLDYRYHYSDAELLEDWQRLVNCQSYKRGAQFKPGMKLCQHFFPNFWHIENAQGQSFAKLWQDPVIMDEVRTWGLQGMSQLWLSWIRRAVYMRGGLANSSFYRPHFSRQAIDQLGLLQGELFDPCAGWGGRLLGTVSAGWHYTACEPNPETYDNLCRLVAFLGIGHRVTLHNMPVEDFDISTLTPDIVLTSPPYFNLERYTSDQNQSYNKFSDFQNWRDHWFVPLMNRCLDQIHPEGISAWNVQNFQRNDLVGAVFETHETQGWHLVGTLGFDSPLNNIRKIRNPDVTYLFRRES